MDDDKVTKVELRGGTPFVRIDIPLQYFSVLRKWASVGRTIDAAVRLIEEACVVAEIDVEQFEDRARFAEQANYVVNELSILKQPLAAAGSACLDAYFRMAQEAAPKPRFEARLVLGDERELFFQTEQQMMLAFGAMMGSDLRVTRKILPDQPHFKFGLSLVSDALEPVLDSVLAILSEVFDVKTVAWSETWWE